MRHKLLILLFLLCQHSHQEIRDASFVRFCQNFDGQFNMQQSGQQMDRGDMCTVTFPFPAATQEEAEDYCQSWDMYPIAEAKLVNGNPQCKYESVYQCKPDYTLFKGFCYKLMPEKFVTYEEAKKMCRDEKVVSIFDSSKKLTVEIVKMYDQDLIRFFKAYFTNMGMFFIQNIPEMIANLKIEYNGNGDDYALAFGMAPVYKTGQGAVIRLPKETKARVMCSYKPEETSLSYSYMVKKLAPYYYPTADNGQVWRTAGHHSVQHPQDEYGLGPSKKCEASMRALVGKMKGDGWDASKINVNELDDTFKLATVKSVLSYSYCSVNPWGQSIFESSVYPDWIRPIPSIKIRNIYNREVSCIDLPDLPETTHLFNSRKYETHQLPITVMFYPQAVDGYNIRPSGLYDVMAPVFCNLHYHIPTAPKSCEQGWTPYKRANGLTVCHKVFHDVKKTFYGASDFCHTHQGALATFTTEDEYRLFVDLIGVGHYEGVWLGLRKKIQCGPYGTGECSRERIFEFYEPLFGDDTYVARGVMARKWLPGEPNNYQSIEERCIHTAHYIRTVQGPLLNDITCSQDYTVACIKAPI